jgi:hypothetical protein
LRDVACAARSHPGGAELSSADQRQIVEGGRLGKKSAVWKLLQFTVTCSVATGSAVLNGKIYAIGGFVGGAVHKDGQNTAFEHDPTLDTWRILAPMKVAAAPSP